MLNGVVQEGLAYLTHLIEESRHFPSETHSQSHTAKLQYSIEVKQFNTQELDLLYVLTPLTVQYSTDVCISSTKADEICLQNKRNLLCRRKNAFLLKNTISIVTAVSK